MILLVELEYPVFCQLSVSLLKLLLLGDGRLVGVVIVRGPSCVQHVSDSSNDTLRLGGGGRVRAVAVTLLSHSYHVLVLWVCQQSASVTSHHTHQQTQCVSHKP